MVNTAFLKCVLQEGMQYFQEANSVEVTLEGKGSFFTSSKILTVDSALTMELS